MLLSGYGIREWGLITVIAAALAGVAAWLGWWWALVPIFIIWLGLAAFFRDPIRSIPRDLNPGDMLSPADGVISAIEEVVHHDATGGPAVIIRIFLSVLNVHINRSPCDGTVIDLTYTPGTFLDARSEESAKVNEWNLVTLRISPEETLGIRQVSGAIARRIVCPIDVGDRLERGQKFGMIKFGSTTELILPRPGQVTVRVKKGDKVRAGKTVLATLPPADQ